MGGSLAVFKLINPDKENLMKKELNSSSQCSFADLNLSDGLGYAKSVLKFRHYDDVNNRIHYIATHYSDTINAPIRIFLDNIEDVFAELVNTDIQNIPRGMHTVNQYQPMDEFDVVIDLGSEEIFVFVNKKIANVFMKRFKKSKYLTFEKIYFNMRNIKNIPDLADIWGLWENSTGRCKKKAFFGTNVHEHEEVNMDNVTSYNVNYEYDGETIVNFFIMIDCRLSSTSKRITNAELFETYNVVKNSLGITNIANNAIEVFEEEI
ncbi:hypothetical protein ACSAZL_01165 [Methanosarcina sp. T3]|uniref:hypothetical protein n=1 Tax=Methanosarcina sp. T3 TaxID=3439062 RepID=UPI003F87B559